MNNTDYDRIRLLLDKYDAGETSNAEEALLRKFFATHSNDIPAEWQPYAALFGFVETERKKIKAEGNATATKGNTRKKRLRIVTIISVAASLLLLFSLFAGRESSSECYMIVDGKKYTDRKEVKQEALEALQMVGENTDDDPFSAMKMMR